MTMISAGDWVQAIDEVWASLEFEGPDVRHAHAGSVGHILENIDGEWFVVYWERSGLTTGCHVSEFRWLCNGNASVTSQL